MELLNDLVGCFVHNNSDVAADYVGLLDSKLFDPGFVRFVPSLDVTEVELAQLRVRQFISHVHLVH